LDFSSALLLFSPQGKKKQMNKKKQKKLVQWIRKKARTEELVGFG
jgi:hypothetical protein